MSTLAWDDRYATGVPAIDAQHKALFQSAQDLQEAVAAGTPDEAVTRVLDHLVTYCKTHFADEETHMDRLGFPELAAHQEEHRKLMARVYGLLERHATGEQQVPMELSILITHWLRAHIREFDQRMADYVRKTEPEAH
jgi:hemerythrin-like metal-binding protein